MPTITLRQCAITILVALVATNAGAVRRIPQGRPGSRPPIYSPPANRNSAVPLSDRLGVFEVYGAIGSPTGSIDHLGDITFRNRFRQINIHASDVYRPSYSVGLTVGTLQMGHWQNSIGFKYSRLHVKDTIFYPRGDSAIVFNDEDFPKPNFNQYELRANSNWQFYDLRSVGWTPYVGFGLGVGLISQSLEGYDSHNEINAGLFMNFGAEFRVWNDGAGNLATLASMNSWEFAGSGYRPKTLSFGLGFKIYSHF